MSEGGRRDQKGVSCAMRCFSQEGWRRIRDPFPPASEELEMCLFQGCGSKPGDLLNNQLLTLIAEPLERGRTGGRHTEAPWVLLVGRESTVPIGTTFKIGKGGRGEKCKAGSKHWCSKGPEGEACLGRAMTGWPLACLREQGQASIALRASNRGHRLALQQVHVGPEGDDGGPPP